MNRAAFRFLSRLLVVAATLSLGRAYAEIVAVPSIKYHDYYLMLNNDELKAKLGSLAKLLGPDFHIVAKECGVINAYYVASQKSIVLCYEYLADGDSYIKSAYKKEHPKTQAQLNSGIFFFVLLHELGHAIIDIKQIPVIGGEEDAADKIAGIILLEFAKTDPSLTRTMFVGFLSHSWNGRSGFLKKLMSDRNLYADEHPLNEQRVFNLVCLAYGSDPALFADVARGFKLPPDRARRCKDEYQDAYVATRTLLK